LTEKKNLLRVAYILFLVLITGPTPGGLGAETAKSLARASPSTIILIGRALQKAQLTIDEVKTIDPSITVKFFVADLESMKSVREVAQAILADDEIAKIDVVINNAAIMTCPYRKTEDGFERQFATNYLSHFVLTNKLMPKILAAAPGARIVNVSSVGNKYISIQWDDPNLDEEGAYSPMKGYGQSKTANILFTIALNKRLGSHGVRAFALNPGSIRTNLQVYMDLDIAEDASRVIFGQSLAEATTGKSKTVQQGCSTQLTAALSTELDGAEGVYLNDCQLTTDPWWVAPWSLNEADAERLWRMTEGMVGEKFEY
jgi:NAD(P)-dependent dehydrogenase (short-subunit alcohol dehydrogenase family)